MHVQSILDHFQHLTIDLPRSLNVKWDGSTRLPIYAFQLVFNSNIWPNSAALRDISPQSLSDRHMGLSMSLRSTVIAPMDSPIYAFLLMIYSNIWPNSAPLLDILLRNPSDLDFLSRVNMIVSLDSLKTFASGI